MAATSRSTVRTTLGSSSRASTAANGLTVDPRLSVATALATRAIPRRSRHLACKLSLPSAVLLLLASAQGASEPRAGGGGQASGDRCLEWIGEERDYVKMGWV
jgi:hypothetical protein